MCGPWFVTRILVGDSVWHLSHHGLYLSQRPVFDAFATLFRASNVRVRHVCVFIPCQQCRCEDVGCFPVHFSALSYMPLPHYFAPQVFVCMCADVGCSDEPSNTVAFPECMCQLRGYMLRTLLLVSVDEVHLGGQATVDVGVACMSVWATCIPSS